MAASCGGHFSSSSLESLDGVGQAGALLVDPALARVGRGERLGELDRVVADDLVDRRPIGGGPLPQVGEVVQHRHHHGRVAVGDAAVVHEVALEGLRGRRVRLGQRRDAGLVLPVCLLVIERAR